MNRNLRLNPFSLLLVLMIILLTAGACKIPNDSDDGNNNNNNTGNEETMTKWGLWNNGTRLRFSKPKGAYPNRPL